MANRIIESETEKQTEEAAQLYKEKRWSLSQIARRQGVAITTVKNRLAGKGVPLRPTEAVRGGRLVIAPANRTRHRAMLKNQREPQDIDGETLLKRHSEGENITTLAREYGLSRGDVIDRLTRTGKYIHKPWKPHGPIYCKYCGGVIPQDRMGSGTCTPSCELKIQAGRRFSNTGHIEKSWDYLAIEERIREVLPGIGYPDPLPMAVLEGAFKAHSSNARDLWDGRSEKRRKMLLDRVMGHYGYTRQKRSDYYRKQAAQKEEQSAAELARGVGGGKLYYCMEKGGAGE